jgi:hypothetical protein
MIWSANVPAQADIYRCPNGALVSTGDSIAVVAIKCDPPSYKTSRVEGELANKRTAVPVSVEEWTYNEGSNRLIHILTFRNGVLTQVQSGGYGK